MKSFLTWAAIFFVGSLSAAPFIYVTNGEGGDVVTVVDAATNELIATIPVGLGPFDVVITPLGDKAYVTNQADNTVSVIDTATNTVIATVPVGIAPAGITITHDGSTVYVTNAGSNTITPIDVATNTAGAPIAGFNSPVDITISPNDSTAYVANGGNATVTPVDLATGTLGTPIPVSVSPRSIQISPNGQRVYVVTNSGFLNVIDTATNTVIATLALGGGALDDVVVSFDSRRIYVSAPITNTVFVISADTNTVIDTLTVTEPQGLAFHPCGNIVYIANDTGTITPLFVANDTLGSAFPGGPEPFRIAVTPINRVQGKIIKNIFLNKVELVVRINWNILPITNAAFFRIFQDGVVVGQVFAGSPSNFVVCLSPNFVGHSSCSSSKCSSSKCSSSSDQTFNVELGLFAASGVEIARIPVT